MKQSAHNRAAGMPIEKNHGAKDSLTSSAYMSKMYAASLLPCTCTFGCCDSRMNGDQSGRNSTASKRIAPADSAHDLHRRGLRNSAASSASNPMTIQPK